MFSQEFFRIAHPTHFYNFDNNGYTTDAATGQEYMNVTPTAIAGGATPSTYSFGYPGITTATTAEVHRLGGPNTHILGALYYVGGVPSDYQYGISETGKTGETHLQCANRGLIEELGLEFTRTPVPFRTFAKNTRTGQQNCQVFIVHASTVRPASNASVSQAIVTRMNEADPPTGTPVNKAQVIVYGSLAQLQALGATITHKPVKPVTREFYDAPIKGFVIRPA